MSPYAFLVFNTVLLVAAASDLRRYRIPNVLPALLAIASLLLAPPHGVDEALSRAGSVALVGGIAGALWLRGLIGGGDLKLMAACAAWMPLGGLPVFAVALGLASGLQGLATLAVALARAPPPSAARSRVARTRVAYAVSIAAGGLVWSLLRLNTA
jgi:prepilin peptidase CpaA